VTVRRGLPATAPPAAVAAAEQAAARAALSRHLRWLEDGEAAEEARQLAAWEDGA
jgi:hypothetical protein